MLEQLDLFQIIYIYMYEEKGRDFLGLEDKSDDISTNDLS